MSLDSPQVRKLLLGVARSAQTQLSAFRTPSTGEPVDPSHVASIRRYWQSVGGAHIQCAEEFLAAASRSYLATYTRSSRPQLEKAVVGARYVLNQVCKQIMPSADEAEQLAAAIWALAWAERMLRTRERVGHAK